MLALLKKLLKDEKGQGLTEYALIIALIAIAVIGVMLIFRNQIRATFGTITTGLQSS